MRAAAKNDAAATDNSGKKEQVVDKFAWQPIVYDSTKKYIYLTFDDGPQHGNDIGKAIKADNSGNIYLGGLTQYNSLSTPFVVKFNASGVKQWEYFQPNLTMNGDLTAIALDAFTKYLLNCFSVKP